ncbi:3-hydroxyacyl-CoA dehydrogenase NAD-binding domain-containing protein [Pusillimonas sp. SM2304]|uniref:3-hydroxyacyl-CoA dehydrogenase NAD-binding domain-containing protein n=1 Tax=Pusillimonas sp. SM2304 TaxID=3073241 RepID=UPI0028745A2E|nr:3-hydroxyacyl-CoA dehydrogenase NAD-binding domain-containing protein [Pusillimonas sp. SM2304]MDS1139206.1 3-hydroxyacyl-CoA dehydrogenase NAD-binding domain-containing protein [Pusillimonas sp. SM2304]
MSNSTSDNTNTFLSDTVRYAVHGNVAVITLDNPPVNGLGDTVRAGIYAGIERAGDDARINAVVLIGAGKGFSGGADIRQFNTPAANAQPTLRAVIARIEASGKPVIAAIHGFALGGGLELALGCHYRIAQSATRLGLPEVSLGLIPGGGGTQRLPRLVGAATALSMIQGGKPVDAQAAQAIGLVDALAQGDLLDEALTFARSCAAKATHPVIGRRSVDAKGLDFNGARTHIRAKARNALAQGVAIDCVEAATRLPFEAGLDEERRQFDALVDGDVSKSLRHLFFAEKEAPRIAGAHRGKQAGIDIQRIGILGAGTMGGGIAMACANAGFPVVLCEREQAALDRGLARMRKNYEITAAKGKLSQDDIEQRLGLITPSLDLNDFADMDLVIEAVFEDIAVKKDVFRQLDAVCKWDAILATNTSRLNIDEIAASIGRPESVIGLHFFSPANVMKLLEVVRGAKTRPDVIAASMDIAQRIGKIPVLVGVCEGFVGNRMLTGYWREAGFLLEEGASPQQVDGALTRFGMAMGPLAMADLAGMDINWATRKRLAPTRPAHLRYSKVADRICERGRFGQKTGAGYYRYEAGSRTPLPDPIVDEIIQACAREAGIARREITDEEIVERCMLALVNEGAQIIDEGIVQRASDIDVIYVNGYGFPATRGGPMFYAQTLGLETTLKKISDLRSKHDEHWKPAPLLERLVAKGAKTF